MKYIIEIKPEYEDSFKGVMILGAKDSNLFVDTLAVENLEELNSDCINEHFGYLQDEAYQRGLEDGKAINDKGCEGCKYEEVRDERCRCCTNFYCNQWTAKDDKIEVGDEVEHTVSGYTSKAIFLDLEKIKDDEDWYKCLFWTGCGVTILSYPKSQFKRTGRHFDIDKILEEMRT